MNKQQALELVAQALQDFLNTLPVSAKIPSSQAFQQALNVLEEPVKDDSEKKAD